MLNSLVKSSKFKSRKRLGRGMSSGLGKTSGRGHKGQKARSGVSLLGFEGGQNPLYMRLPKRGFNSLNARARKETLLLNIRFLDEMCKKHGLKKLDIALLREKNIARKYHNALKLVGNFEVKTKIEIVCNKVSGAARKSLENSGSKITTINK